MLRIYRILAYQALAALNLVRSNLGIENAWTLAEFLTRNWDTMTPGDPHRENLRDAISYLQDMPNEGLEEIEREFGEFIHKSNQSKSGDDFALLNTLVDVLKLGYGANYISSGALRSLRRALLLPDELNAWLTKYGNHKLAVCKACGTDITNGEVVTFQDDAVLCVRCHTPTFTKCSHSHKGCELITKLSSSTQKTLINADCGCSKNDKKEEGEEGITTGVGLGGGILDVAPRNVEQNFRNFTEILRMERNIPPTRTARPTRAANLNQWITVTEGNPFADGNATHTGNPFPPPPENDLPVFEDDDF